MVHPSADARPHHPHVLFPIMSVLRAGAWVCVLIGVTQGVLGAEERQVSVVLSRSIPPYLEALEGAQEVLHDAGIQAADVHDVNGDPKEGVRIAVELTKRHPDVVLTVGTEATQLISARTPGVPVIFSMVVHAETLMSANPSLAGASMEVAPQEQLRWLTKLLPNATRIGLLYTPSLHEPGVIERYRRAAHELGVDLVVEAVHDVTEVPLHLRTLLPTIHAFWLIPDETLLAPETARHIMLETLRGRVPVLAPSWAFVEEGALVAVACDYHDVGRQTGELAVRVLRREPLGSDRVLEARLAHLYLNMRIAKALGIPVPPELVAHADRTVQ